MNQELIPHHEYHQSLNTKIPLCGKPGKLITTIEQSLERIKNVHAITKGLKQIVYLVGWQYEGHDSKYPAFFEVNEKLKRPQDKDARESLLWLMEQGFAYNAVVSTHINLCDAYENSPLWDEYVEEDLLVREADGSLQEGAMWGGEQSYRVSKTREFATGYTQKRIDQFLELLPIAKAGTVHIDAFFPKPSPYHDVTWQDEVNTMHDIFRYWHEKGIDVTAELFLHEYAGFMPWALHLNLDEESRLKYPPSVISGGTSVWNQRKCRNAERVAWVGQFTTPEAGTRYEEAWGYPLCPTHENDSSPGGFAKMFFTRTLPWLYMNSRQIIQHVHTSDSYEVHLTGDLVSKVNTQNNHYCMVEEDRLLVDGTDIFVAPPYRENEVFAYSLTGCEREWRLPNDWNVKSVALSQLHPIGLAPIGEVPVSDGQVRIRLEPNQAMCVSPV